MHHDVGSRRQGMKRVFRGQAKNREKPMNDDQRGCSWRHGACGVV